MTAEMKGLYNTDINDSFINTYNNNKIIDNKIYINNFEKKTISKKRYRTILKTSDPITKGSKIFSDINTFLLPFDELDEDYKDNLGEAIIELLDNAREHGKSDCLLDINILDNLKKDNKNSKIPDDKNYIGFDISIVNFSNILLGDKVKKNIKNDISIGTEEKTKLIKEAYKNHSKYFNDSYTEEDFYNIASFQRHVSGRSNAEVSIDNGGTGLTNFIENLLSQSIASFCYMMTGEKFIFFRNDFMKVSENGTIGFNEDNNFISSPPAIESLKLHKGIYSKMWYHFNGTSYNLNFIKETEGKNEKNNFRVR